MEMKHGDHLERFGLGFTVLTVILAAAGAALWVGAWILADQQRIYAAVIITAVVVVSYGLGYWLDNNDGSKA